MLPDELEHHSAGIYICCYQFGRRCDHRDEGRPRTTTSQLSTVLCLHHVCHILTPSDLHLRTESIPDRLSCDFCPQRLLCHEVVFTLNGLPDIQSRLSTEGMRLETRFILVCKPPFLRALLSARLPSNSKGGKTLCLICRSRLVKPRLNTHYLPKYIGLIEIYSNRCLFYHWHSY
jgi:hypothetical protein